jgi:hypothetical protein
VLAGLPSPFEAVRYHSLVVERETLPEELEVTAETANGLIMGLRHRTLPVEGVQFHPESILTGVGKRILGSFLDQVAAHAARATTGSAPGHPNGTGVALGAPPARPAGVARGPAPENG